MNKKFLNENYNLVKVLTATEPIKLSKSYKDNLENIIVLMEKKRKTPQQPPEWFVLWNKNVFQKVIDNRAKDHKLLLNLEMRIDNLVKVNNLRE